MILRAGLGPMTLISVEETGVSEDMDPRPAPEWAAPAEGEGDWGPEAVEVSAPRFDPNNHRYTVSLSGRDPMIVMRGETPEEIAEALRDLERSPVYALLASAKQAMSSYGPAPTAPAPMAPPMPAQPQGWGAPAPAMAPAPGMAPPAPGGGAQRAGTAAAPPGWYRIEVPWGAKDAFKEYREQNKVAFSGKIKWKEKGTYFVSPDVVQYFQAYGPVAA